MEASKKKIPKKAIVTTPNNYLYLVIESDSHDIKLLRVVHKHLLERLFKTNLVVMLVPEAML